MARIDGVADRDLQTKFGGGRRVQAREPRIQHQLDVAQREQRVLLERDLPQVPEVGHVAVGHVRVRFDQARHGCHAFAVDDVHAGFPLDPASITRHLADHVAIDEYLARKGGVPCPSNIWMFTKSWGFMGCLR
jgi:xanthine/CO dehydrogenase XdhC/CoxF family maturation factor